MSARENDEELRLLYARLEDLCDVAARGDVAISDFFSPAQLHFAKVYLKRKGVGFSQYGGYPSAERQRVYIFPDYMEALAFDLEEDALRDLDGELSLYGFSSEITALKIKGSGYRRLTHRDFLGSVLGLGIERSVLGDILVLEEGECEAIILTDRAISEYIVRELTFVSRDKVRVEPVNKGEWEPPVRRMQPIHDTVASARLDAVVAALCDLSRDKARTAVVSGLVEI